MHKPMLVIGNRNYSSWSLRAWLALVKSGAEFDVERLPLDTPRFHAEIGRYSPTRRVPVLLHGERTVWESLAIAEYANEIFAGNGLWPAGEVARAHARSVSAEMHAGFPALRGQMPMNCRARGRSVARTPALARDIERITALWTECRDRFGHAGPWLYGGFSVADAMFAPVVSRFRTYGEALAGPAGDYAAMVMDDPDVSTWMAAAALEPETVEADETGLDA